MAKRQPFDTNLNFPPPPTRALLSTPLDGIIGGLAPRPEPPPPEPIPNSARAPMPAAPESAPEEIDTPRMTVEAVGSEPPPPEPPLLAEPAHVLRPDLVSSVERSEPADDGKVTVKLPPELKNRLYNAIYAERGTVGDFLTRAVDDLMDQLERDRGGPYPQRPPADVKFRAGRRPR